MPDFNFASVDEAHLTLEQVFAGRPAHPLVVPIVNLNGDRKAELVDQMRAVLDAFRLLETSLGQAMPHGRNYQTHRNAFADQAARRAWVERRTVLGAMRAEFEAYAEAIANQEGR